MIYLMIWSFFVFDQLPDFWTLVGAAIVVGAGLYIGYREQWANRAGRRANAEPS
jgi:drug/metabolite transporter (DMT)-like permease